MTQDGPLPPRPPLGERLDAQGRRLTARLVTTLPWAGPLHVFIDHASGLVVCGGRFDRIERDADRPPRLTATAVRRRPRPGVGPSPGGPPTPVPPSLPLPEAPAARRRRLYHRISRCPKLPRRNGRRPRPCHRTRATLCPPRSDRGCGRPSAPRPTLCGCTTTTSPARSRGNNGRMPSPSGGTSSSDTADCGRRSRAASGCSCTRPHTSWPCCGPARPGIGRPARARGPKRRRRWPMSARPSSVAGPAPPCHRRQPNPDTSLTGTRRPRPRFRYPPLFPHRRPAPNGPRPTATPTSRPPHRRHSTYRPCAGT